MTTTSDLEARLRRDLTELAAIPTGRRARREPARGRPATAGLLAAAVVLVLLAAGVGVAWLSARSTASPHPGRPAGTAPAPAPDTSTITTAPTASTDAPSTTGEATTTLPSVALQSVDWSAVTYPIEADCGTVFHPAVTVQQVAYATPPGGGTVAVVLTRCNSGAGTPSSALDVFDGATSLTSPHLAATLVRDLDDWQASAVSMAGATLSLPVDGFSSQTVANCCPDVHTTLVWNWTATGYVLSSTVPPHFTYQHLG